MYALWLEDCRTLLCGECHTSHGSSTLGEPEDELEGRVEQMSIQLMTIKDECYLATEDRYSRQREGAKMG